MNTPITYAGCTWPSARDWCLSIMQHNAAPGPAQDGQSAALDAFAAEVLHGAAEADATPDFFQIGHTYADTDPEWKFRVDTVTTHPDNGERTALGWRFFRGEWEPYAYGEDDWEIHQLVGHTDVTETPTPELTVYRASHESIAFGPYTTIDAARQHCEDYARRDSGLAGLMNWVLAGLVEDDSVEELTVDGAPTGYVVTALTVASECDKEAGE